MRDDRPFSGADPPAAAYCYSPDRRGEHPEAHLASWAGLMQADAYASYDRLYAGGRKASYRMHARLDGGQQPAVPCFGIDPEICRAGGGLIC